MRPAFLGLLLLAAAARAEEPPQPWSVAFAGGALLPQGAMAIATQVGLEVGARFGWSAPSGLGLQLGVDFAPLRRADDAQLFAGTLGPRFTLGHDVIRVWIAGAGGVVVERAAAVSSSFALFGLGGLDLHLFGNGGFTFAGQYARGVSSDATEYLAVSGGLLFTM
jgi:hypothetical protein